MTSVFITRRQISKLPYKYTHCHMCIYQIIYTTVNLLSRNKMISLFS